MDKLERLQLDIAALLGAVAALQYTRTVVASPRIDANGDLVTAPEIIEALDRALNGIDQTNGKAGTIAVVQMPTEAILDHKLRGADGYPCQASVIIRVEENLLINRGEGGGQRTCTELANDIFIALQGYSLAGALLLADDKRTKEPKQYRDGILACDVRFTLIWDRPATARCKGVQITATSLAANPITVEGGGSIITEGGDHLVTEQGGGGSGLRIQLSTATAGASIYYTTDGSFPTSANGTLYAAEFDITTDCTLRAVAYKTGLNPSPLLESVIDVA